MKALVTGGGGFVGKELVRMLRARGDTVRVLARGDYPELRELGVETVRGDLADKAAVGKAVAGMDVVFHVAAKAGIWGDPDEFEQSNVSGTQNIIDACIEGAVERLVYTSSSSVTFAGTDAVDADESMPYPSKHYYDYGRTKAEAERRVLAANGTPHKDAKGNKLPSVLLTCALRTPLIVGAGDPHLVPMMVKRARAGRIAVLGRGDNVVDITYVENAAHAHLLAADALAQPNPKPAGKAYFIANGSPINPWQWVNALLREIGVPEITRRVPLGLAVAVGSVAELVWRVFRLKGEPLMTRFAALQLATSRTYTLKAARADLGYEPIVDDAEGMRRILAWLKAEVAAGRM
ncbi:MAG: NAD-dependent epimerase/dehydratase family protein [Deltaproteobacteria bacterium]|nr:NAD-dependent epimerase/dehydratase family protein [Deltaproteobacteria bacterium]